MTIDITLPHYGDTKYLKLAIDSILSQKYQNWRLIVVDDGGGDETKGLIDKIKKQTKNEVKYVKNEKNLGFARNFQKCLDSVKNDWFVVMGNDDIMLPNFLEQFAEIKNKDFDLYQPTVRTIDSAGRVSNSMTDRIKKMLSPRKAGIYQGEKLASSLMVGNWLYFPSIIWHTETARKYNFDSKFGDLVDMGMELDIILGGGKLFWNKSDVSFYYRRHAASASSLNAKNGKHQQDEKVFYDWAIDRFKQQGWRKAERNARMQITSRVKKLIDRF